MRIDGVLRRVRHMPGLAWAPIFTSNPAECGPAGVRQYTTTRLVPAHSRGGAKPQAHLSLGEESFSSGQLERSLIPESAHPRLRGATTNAQFTIVSFFQQYHNGIEMAILDRNVPYSEYHCRSHLTTKHRSSVSLAGQGVVTKLPLCEDMN
jgi:hypothetical protein